MHYLCYREVNRLSTLCRLSRQFASRVLRVALRNLVPQIEKQMNDLEANVKSRNNSSILAMTVRERRHAAMLHTVLRVLLAEARIPKATC
jgi:hypothetical protein